MIYSNTHCIAVKKAPRSCRISQRLFGTEDVKTSYSISRGIACAIRRPEALKCETEAAKTLNSISQGMVCVILGPEAVKFGPYTVKTSHDGKSIS